MFGRWLPEWLILAVMLGMVSCRPQGTVLLDDDHNPFIASGLRYRAAMEYEAAIDAFERALEKNPASVRAHYELGLLYEKQKQEYVTAIYHYNRVLKLRPKGYPSENVRLLIAGCRQELVKAEALAPVTQAMQQDLERLREENALLRDELNQLNARLASLKQTAADPVPAPEPSRNASGANVRPPDGPPPAISSNPTASRTRSHAVRAGETFYSIARLYNVDVKKLIAANPGVAPSSMPAGYILRIP
jgi:tetratricopeptide (TPR) repeat protein